MVKYPELDDSEFYNELYKIYNKYEIKKDKKSLKEYCNRTKFKLQLPQKFVAGFINPETPYKGVLIYHRIGAGKTCSAVNIAEQWKGKRKIIIIVPAALVGNFRDELRSQCADYAYLTKAETKIIKNLSPNGAQYTTIIKKSNIRIDKVYKILSYHKFVMLAKENKINLKNSLLIIDEIQNMISETGTFYKTLLGTINRAPNDLRVVLLSATPMFDKPSEIGLTMNVLRLPHPFPTGSHFNDMFLSIKKKKSGNISYKAKNMTKFKKMIQGHVSYYRGAPPHTFPDVDFKIVKCKMESFQYKSYLTALSTDDHFYRGSFRHGDILSLPNDFFLGERIISNVAFPNRSINITGFNSFRGDKLLMKNLSEYSIKFYKILKKIRASEGPIFFYSNFKEYGGIKSFIKVLKKHKFKNYKTHGSGLCRFAVWTGDERHEMKEEIKRVFNQKSNLYGEEIKILLGSPSIKEGVSLLRVEQVHILEPYWNMSRMDQIIGRAIRFCSHHDVKPYRRKVSVYLYLATSAKGEETVDEYIWQLAKEKNKLISKFEMALKESAVDCKLNKIANVYPGEDEIECFED
jgi:superfamily II DNA or RNA helicase